MAFHLLSFPVTIIHIILFQIVEEPNAHQGTEGSSIRFLSSPNFSNATVHAAQIAKETHCGRGKIVRIHHCRFEGAYITNTLFYHYRYVDSDICQYPCQFILSCQASIQEKSKHAIS